LRFVSSIRRKIYGNLVRLTHQHSRSEPKQEVKDRKEIIIVRESKIFSKLLLLNKWRE